MRKTILAASAAALACASAAAHAQTAPAAAMDAAPRDAGAYLAKAGASDLYEIRSSELAQQKASTAAVRQFGKMMIEHHTMTTRKLTAAAKSAGMTPPPPVLEPQQQAMIDELSGLSGAAFDTAYLRQQRLAHDQALALHSGYAKDGDTPALRQTANAAVPIIKRHIDQLRKLPNG